MNYEKEIQDGLVKMLEKDSTFSATVQKVLVLLKKINWNTKFVYLQL